MTDYTKPKLPYAPGAFISVGADVAADFTWFTMMDPCGNIIGKTFKMVHDDPESRNDALQKIREAQQASGIPCIVFMESTGIYHFPLLRFFEKNTIEISLLNPILTKHNIIDSVRKVHSDKVDSRKIAKIGLQQTHQCSIIPDSNIQALRKYVRDQDYLKTEQTAIVLKLRQHLKITFPKYAGVFSTITCKTSLAILEKYPTAEAVRNVPEADLTDLIATVARKGRPYAEKKAKELKEAAQDAADFSWTTPADADHLRSLLDVYRSLDEHVQTVLGNMERFIAEHEADQFAVNIKRVQSIPGCGLLSAAIVVAEMGDPKAFSNRRQLSAFFGFDPVVRQSGKFKAEHTKMSKRGSAIARRAFNTIAVQSIRVINGKPLNPVLREEWEARSKGKGKGVAIGALTHKICCIVFAMLRDGKDYEMIKPEDQRNHWEAVKQARAV